MLDNTAYYRIFYLHSISLSQAFDNHIWVDCYKKCVYISLYIDIGNSQMTLKYQKKHGKQ